MSDVAYQIAELNRRLGNGIRLGTIAQADYPAARVRVQSGDLLTDWLPWLTQRAGPDITWWAPEVGEQVVVFSPDGDTANAFVMGALYQSQHPAPEEAETVHRVHYADGTSVSYDRAASHLQIDCVGEITIETGADITVMCGAKITVVSAADVAVTASGPVDISASGAVTITSAASIALSAPTIKLN